MALRLGNKTSLPLYLLPSSFVCQPSFLGCRSGPGRQSRFGFCRCSADKFNQSRHGVPPVLLLAAKAPGIYDQNPFLVDFFPGQSGQSFLNLCRQERARHIEPQLHGRGCFIDFLAARSRGADEDEADGIFVNGEFPANTDHNMKLTRSFPGFKRPELISYQTWVTRKIASTRVTPGKQAKGAGVRAAASAGPRWIRKQTSHFAENQLGHSIAKINSHRSFRSREVNLQMLFQRAGVPLRRQGNGWVGLHFPPILVPPGRDSAPPSPR
jgi:hypothetical protein